MIIMANPSGTCQTRAGIVDVNEYGNDRAWENLGFSATTSTGSASLISEEAFRQHAIPSDLRAIATDYHDSMAA